MLRPENSRRLAALAATTALRDSSIRRGTIKNKKAPRGGEPTRGSGALGLGGKKSALDI